MRYLSVCSGIEAATVAWHGLGWQPVAFSEIEKFPSAVLAHHYPSTPNWGDMTKFQEWPDAAVDVLVGGTPCQSFSVAGLRKGLEDPRGNLMLTFLAIARRYRPRWVVWENVPGVLSSNGGRDFGTFLRALGELGYGWAYRVLDAQWFGVAQRRRRVFVVGCLGDWERAAAVLFERESVRRDTAPSREARQGVAPGVGGGPDGGRIAGAVTRKWSKGSGGPAGDECYNMVAQPVKCATGDITHALTTRSAATEDGTTHAMGCGSKQGSATVAVAHAFKVRGGVEREDGSRGSTNIGKQAGKGYLGSDELAFTVASSPDQYLAHHVTFAKTHKPMSDTDPEGWSPVDASPTITHWPRDRSDGGTDVAVVQLIGTDCYNGAITGNVAATIGTPGSSVNASGPTVMQPLAMRESGHGYWMQDEISDTMRAGSNRNGKEGTIVAQPVGSFKPGQSAAARSIGYETDLAPSLEGGGGGNNKPAVHVAMQVRRLTPVECERLQGFPDGYTNIPWRKKPEAPDGPCYKALGNSMAVPVMRWIGERIQRVSSAQPTAEAPAA